MGAPDDNDGAMTDRRAHPRFPLILSVDYADGAGGVRDSTQNLSADGIFIRTEREFELGDRIPLILSFPQLLEPVELEVEVTWKGDADGAGRGVGVRVPEDRVEHRARLAQLARRAAEAANRPAVEYRVLLVEDNTLVASMYSAALQKLAGSDQSGFEIERARDGAEALARLRRLPRIDLLVTDLHMPVMSGLELVRKVRGEAAGADLPVVVISSRMDEEQAELERLGVRLFLRKPVKYADLVQTVRALLPAGATRARAATGGRSPAGPEGAP